ncbi:hypothetical protein PMAYCL1PPCAC_07214 [Pristionchus mayeri]|uniref:RING-type E3 ubiquitin transferase n=1 Tax=Pristionchus mayeri TaxID=1317129 RepID=A0AAN4ZCD8_9BILA|nr:hypothetical protein PMAYCL1PPCAC_07214 [Pristionchus mayeri]
MSTSDNVGELKEEKVEMDESGSTAAEDPCPVCLSNRVDESAIDGCSHTFCYSCISEWLKVSESCPLCKAPVTEVRTRASGKLLIKKLSELKAEAEAARIMVQANEVPMTSEREAVSALIHQQRATVQNIIADKARNKKNRQVNEIYRKETSLLTQLTALKDEMERLPRRDVIGDSRFRRVVYEQQLVWKPITRPSTAIRFNAALACAESDRLMQRLKPFLERELKVVMDPKHKPSERLIKELLTNMQNYEINHPNFETALFTMRLFKPWCIGIFSHLLYEFCASGLELEAFDANSSYSLDPARAPSGRLIPNLLPPSSQTNDTAIFLDEDEEGDEDDSVIIDRAHRSDSSSSDGVTSLYNHRACRLRSSRNPLLSHGPSSFRDLRERLSSAVPSFYVPSFGNGSSHGRTTLFPSQSTSRRIQDPEVISLEDEHTTGDEARINSIQRGDLDSAIPPWLNGTDGGGPSTSRSFGSHLNPLSGNETDGTNKEECWRRGNKQEGRGIETSWRVEKEKKEKAKREKRRHEEKNNDEILGTRVGSRKNTAQYYFNKIMKGDLSIDELQRMNGELTTFANRINYLKEECNRKLAEKMANGHSANGSSSNTGGIDDEIIHVEELPGPSSSVHDDSVIFCDL